jgi:hypothetical protein
VKHPIKVFILLAITSLTLIGCHDEAIKIDSHFIGVWNGSDATYTYHLSIDNRSNGYWEQDKGGKYQSAQGVARAHNGKLSVGLKDFDIDEYPMQDTSGAWVMNLSGIVYTKQ